MQRIFSVTTLTVTVFIGLSLLTGCSSEDTPSSVAEASASPGPTWDGPPTPTPTPVQNLIGSTLSSGGATVTLHAAADAASVSFNSTFFEQGSGLDEYIDQTPAAGNKYFVVSATVKNTGTDPMDLTCGYPIAIKAYSANNQNFGLIDDLYNLEGNPGCNDFMQPESSAAMTWVFEIPLSAAIIGVFFTETFGDSGNPAIFTIDPTYSLSPGS